MHQLEEAQAASSDQQSQLDRLQRSLHSQQQFVTSLEATIAGTNTGETPHGKTYTTKAVVTQVFAARIACLHLCSVAVALPAYLLS